MEHTKHLWRAALLLVAVMLALVFVRHFLVPESFGDEGFYRADSRQEFMALPVVHGGRGSCAECHAEQYQTHAGGKHATVACEVCHLELEDQDDEKIPSIVVNRSRKLCGYCHLKLAARPDTFPQIVDAAHLVDQGVIEPGDPVLDQACKICHPPHDPAQDG